MLYARLVCTYTHTHKDKYDVHAVFSVHVCNSFIHCITCCITLWLFVPPFIFNFSFWVYTNCIHNLCALHLTGIWHTGSWLPWYWTFQLVYTRYILHIAGIPTFCHWIDIILVSLHFITAWSSPDVYPFYCIYTLYTVYALHVLPLPHFTYTKRTCITSGIFIHMFYSVHYMVYISI